MSDQLKLTRTSCGATSDVGLRRVSEMPVARIEPLVMLAKITEGDATPFEFSWLREGLEAYLSSNGQIPLERCLQLPTTIPKWRQSRRDIWLMKAARCIDADSVAAGCAALRAEWSAFVSRGPYRIWKEDAGPPATATPLHEALFWASRLSRSNCLGIRQIKRIAGHVFIRKCQ
jgi:hypothetical protein